MQSSTFQSFFIETSSCSVLAKKVILFNFMAVKNASSLYVTIPALLVFTEGKLKEDFGPESIYTPSAGKCKLSFKWTPAEKCWKVKVPLTSSRSLTASVFPHRAASCRAVPALVCLLMSIPAWINSLTAEDRREEKSAKVRGNTVWPRRDNGEVGNVCDGEKWSWWGGVVRC